MIGFPLLRVFALVALATLAIAGILFVHRLQPIHPNTHLGRADGVDGGAAVAGLLGVDLEAMVYLGADKAGTVWARSARPGAGESELPVWRLRLAQERIDVVESHPSLRAAVLSMHTEMRAVETLPGFWVVDDDGGVWADRGHFDGRQWRTVVTDTVSSSSATSHLDVTVLDDEQRAWIPFRESYECGANTCVAFGLTGIRDGVPVDRIDLSADAPLIPRAIREVKLVRAASGGPTWAIGAREVKHIETDRYVLLPGLVDPTSGIALPGIASAAASAVDGTLHIAVDGTAAADYSPQSAIVRVWPDGDTEANVLDDGPFVPHESGNLPQITGMIQRADGAWWIGTTSGELALWGLDGTWLQHESAPDAPLGSPIAAVALDSEERPWLADERGVRVLDGDQWYGSDIRSLRITPDGFRPSKLALEPRERFYLAVHNDDVRPRKVWFAIGGLKGGIASAVLEPEETSYVDIQAPASAGVYAMYTVEGSDSGGTPPPGGGHHSGQIHVGRPLPAATIHLPHALH